jgi:putative tryptophan/tyrosine transport system substrate-binding protein
VTPKQALEQGANLVAKLRSGEHGGSGGFMNALERRRLLIAAGSWLVAPLASRAQAPGRVYRIGFVSAGSPSRRPSGFSQGLRELGYVEGQNLVIERRYAEWQYERLPGLVEDVIRTKPEVIVTSSSAATRAAMKATRTIPIVFTGVSDPIDTGLVTNLARPGDNVTGFSYAFGDGLTAKWLQLLKQAAPKVTRVAALHSYATGAQAKLVQDLLTAAQVLKLRLDLHYATSAAELDAAMTAISGSGAQALVVTGSPILNGNRPKLIQFAADKRLPAIYFSETFADEGGLMSYGPNAQDVARRAASHVDKILKGAKPGDLPVEQPTQFELVINLKTARTLGLEMPQAVLLSATRFVE